MEGASLRYTTVQNWSKNVLNLVTQRSIAKKDASIEWLDGNLGSRTTMKYPAVYLAEPGARGRVLSVGYANGGQRQDTGAKIIHAAPRTTSVISAKSISQNGGRSSYRGLVKVLPGTDGVKSSVECDALLLDGHSRSDTYPTMDAGGGREVLLSHEARVGRVGDDELFYLMSRGISRKDAVLMVINGFISEFTRELPMEYAVELNRLIELEMEGGIG
jgi:Fe-S cluster assembly protein SufB